MKFAKIKLTSEEFLGKGGEADEVNAGGNGGSAIACGPVIDRQIRQSYPIFSSGFLPLGRLIDKFQGWVL